MKTYSSGERQGHKIQNKTNDVRKFDETYVC